MRYTLLAGALIIGVAIAIHHPVVTVTKVRERKVEVPVRVEVPVPVRIETPQVSERPQTVRPASEKPAVAPPQPLAGVALCRQNMLFLFDREVNLRSDQRKFILDVLAERDRTIEGYQNEIRAQGVVVHRDYNRRISEIQGDSYQKMAQVLDPDQQRRFGQLVVEGRIGDAVCFEVGPKLVVIED